MRRSSLEQIEEQSVCQHSLDDDQAANASSYDGVEVTGKFAHFHPDDLKAAGKFDDFFLTVGDEDAAQSVQVMLQGLTARTQIADLLNAALDARLVQRVVAENSSLPIKEKYTLKKLPDGKVWIMQNLREYVEGAVWNEKYDCYMYTWEQAQKAVPQGFHLPSAQDFTKLNLACGLFDKSNREVSKKLREECGFVFSGCIRDSGALCDVGSYGSWWSSSEYDNDGAYDFWFDTTSVVVGSYGEKNTWQAVRCIQDDD